MSSSDQPFDPPSLASLPRVSIVPAAEEKTEPQAPFPIRVMLRFEKLDRDLAEMKGHCRTAAENSLAAAQAITELRAEMQAHKREVDARLSRIEIERLWMPRIVATAAILIATAALIVSLLAFQRHA